MTRIRSGAAALLTQLVAVAAVAQPVVVMFEHGEAPREEIRYRFEAGSAAQATMTMGMQMSMGGQQAAGMSIPAIQVPMTVRSSDKRPDGSVRLDFDIGAPAIAGGDAVNPALAGQLESSLGALGESSGSYRIDSRGNVFESTFDLPAGTLAQAGQMINEMQGQMQQLSAPFPAEAIGVGARWQVTSSVVMSGMPLTQTTEYTLLARDGDRVELGLATTQAMTAPPTVPGVPAGATAALGELESKGSGKMTVDLTGIVPRYEFTTTTTMPMNMQMQGQSMSMAMQMQMSISIVPD